MKHSFSAHNLVLDRSTSSLRLPEKPYHGTLRGSELLSPYIRNLKKQREELRKVLCQDELDEHGRYKTKSLNERRKAMGEFKSKHPLLTHEAKTVLDWLARNIKESKGLGFPYRWNDFFLGLAGSLGWTIDYGSDIQTLRVAPRTFVTKEKIGATDGKYYTHKERAEYMPLAEREYILSRQREILASLD